MYIVTSASKVDLSIINRPLRCGKGVSKILMTLASIVITIEFSRLVGILVIAIERLALHATGDDVLG